MVALQGKPVVGNAHSATHAESKQGQGLSDVA